MTNRGIDIVTINVRVISKTYGRGADMVVVGAPRLTTRCGIRRRDVRKKKANVLSSLKSPPRYMPLSVCKCHHLPCGWARVSCRDQPHAKKPSRDNGRKKLRSWPSGNAGMLRMRRRDICAFKLVRKLTRETGYCWLMLLCVTDMLARW